MAQNKCKECNEPITPGHHVSNCYYDGTHRGHGIEKDISGCDKNYSDMTELVSFLENSGDGVE